MEPFYKALGAIFYNVYCGSAMGTSCCATWKIGVCFIEIILKATATKRTKQKHSKKRSSSRKFKFILKCERKRKNKVNICSMTMKGYLSTLQPWLQSITPKLLSFVQFALLPTSTALFSETLKYNATILQKKVISTAGTFDLFSQLHQSTLFDPIWTWQLERRFGKQRN